MTPQIFRTSRGTAPETNFENEDYLSSSLWIKNLNSETFVSFGIWEDHFDIDSGVFRREEPTDDKVIPNIFKKTSWN